MSKCQKGLANDHILVCFTRRPLVTLLRQMQGLLHCIKVETKPAECQIQFLHNFQSKVRPDLPL